MPSLDTIADRDQRRHAKLQLENPDGVRFTMEVEFHVNRVTTEHVEVDIAPYFEEGETEDDLDESEIAAIRNAVGFCDMVPVWDLSGPLKNRAGETVIERDQPIPMEPRYVRLVPLWLTNAITQKLLEIVNPNRTSSRRSRKR